MTSERTGVGGWVTGKADNSSDKLREWGGDKGGGSKFPEN